METSECDQFEYNRVPYQGVADGLIELRNIEVLATLFGLSPVPLSSCRVLELGCADGTNLLPFAEEFSDSQFVGVDLARAPIDEAKVAAESVSLSNIEFHLANVAEIGTDFGKFDYILCPGVFSWVAPEERDAILRICRENLSPKGLAVISFNVLPGWNFRGTIRELIRRHVRVFDNPATQISEARRVVDFLAAQTSSSTPHGLLYAQTAATLRTATNHYVYHDYISDRNQPYYFHEFQAMLETNDLQFVTDADISQTAALSLPESARRTLENSPLAEREQLLDFLMNTNYRRALVCHARAEVNRQIDHKSIAEMSITLRQDFRDMEFDVATHDPLELEYDGGSLTTVEPIGKAALRHLMNVWPAPVLLKDLSRIASDMLPAGTAHFSAQDGETDGDAVLGRAMLSAVCARLAKLFRTLPVVATNVSDCPVAAALVRHLAKSEAAMVNQWHQNVQGLSPDERFILSQLDGTHEVSKLIAALHEWRFQNVAEHHGTAAERVNEILEHLLRDRLLLVS